MPGRRGIRGDGYGGSLPREVDISKKMSWLLRHGAEQEGLKLGPGGYVNLKEVVCVSLLFKLCFVHVPPFHTIYAKEFLNRRNLALSLILTHFT